MSLICVLASISDYDLLTDDPSQIMMSMTVCHRVLQGVCQGESGS